MTNEHHNTSGSLLGRMVRERLDQLGVSRRQFCLGNAISRQTLYEIEHQGKTNVLTSTLVALDHGLHWEPGTALRYATGDESAREGEPAGERIKGYVTRIMTQISRLSIDELEREAIWLEEELFGRTSESHDDSMKMIRDAMAEIIPTMQGDSQDIDGCQSRRRTNSGARKNTG